MSVASTSYEYPSKEDLEWKQHLSFKQYPTIFHHTTDGVIMEPKTQDHNHVAAYHFQA